MLSVMLWGVSRMLILTRRPGEAIMIDHEVKLIIPNVKGDQVSIGIEAPREVQVHREEIYHKIQLEGDNRK